MFSEVESCDAIVIILCLQRYSPDVTGNPAISIIMEQLSSAGLQSTNLLLYLLPVATTSCLAAVGFLAWRWKTAKFCAQTADHESAQDHTDHAHLHISSTRDGWKQKTSGEAATGSGGSDGNNDSQKQHKCTALGGTTGSIKDSALMLHCAIVLLAIATSAATSHAGRELGNPWAISTIAASGAVTLLCAAGPAAGNQALAEVSWETLSVLAIIAALNDGLIRLGVMRPAVSAVIAVIEAVPNDSRLFVAVLAILWGR